MSSCACCEVDFSEALLFSLTVIGVVVISEIIILVWQIDDKNKRIKVS